MCLGCSKKHLIETVLLTTHKVHYGWEKRICLESLRGYLCMCVWYPWSIQASRLHDSQLKRYTYFLTKTYVVDTQKNHLNETMFFWALKTNVKADG